MLKNFTRIEDCDGEKVRMWKVPFRSFWTDSFKSLILQTFYCHVVVKLYKGIYNFNPVGIYPDGSYHCEMCYTMQYGYVAPKNSFIRNDLSDWNELKKIKVDEDEMKNMYQLLKQYVIDENWVELKKIKEIYNKEKFLGEK